MRVDLHVHSYASPDSLATPGRILHWAARRNMDALAITDHNTIAIAQEMAQLTSLRIIVGEEVLTRDGELIGLFLHEQVPMRSSAQETASFIHEQGGLVYLPHPYDSWRHSALHQEALPGVMPSVDLVEVFNSRVLNSADNKLAMQLAAREHKYRGAGSDAHLACEIGRAYLELPSFANCAEFLDALGAAQV
jgi:predicted metal-dependent phosphoesterase TrpH